MPVQYAVRAVKRPGESNCYLQQRLRALWHRSLPQRAPTTPPVSSISISDDSPLQDLTAFPFSDGEGESAAEHAADAAPLEDAADAAPPLAPCNVLKHIALVPCTAAPLQDAAAALGPKAFQCSCTTFTRCTDFRFF